jgi:hypothetical protein
LIAGIEVVKSCNEAVSLQGAFKNVGEAVSARQKQAKKRSLRAVNEHFDRTRARACF